MAQITITLTKSPIARLPKQRATVKALGLGKLGSSVVKEDTAANRAQAASIAHLVTVTEGGKTLSKPVNNKDADKKPAAKKAVAKPAEKPVAKKEAGSKPTTASRVSEIKEYLDANGISYSPSDKKADLLTLVK